MDSLYFTLGLTTLFAVVFLSAAQRNTTCYLSCPKGQVLDSHACRCVPERVLVDPVTCPQIKCAGIHPLCLAYKRDSRGCKTCQCLYQCPNRNCPEKCQYGTERFVDRFGCQSCRCKQPPYCVKPKCDLYCQRGYEKDKLGCDICRCKECGSQCKIGCPYGKLVDFNGCSLCECKPKRECGPVCNNSCENGRVLDENGCPTCQCKRKCGFVCARACEHGNVIDINGCPTCQCLPAPTCGPVCANACLYGKVIDENGCPTCQCLSQPPYRKTK